MAHYEDAIHPVHRITAGTLGDLGQRVFLLQAHMDERVWSWVIAREHAVRLGRIIPQLLDDVHAEYPELGQPLLAERPNLTLDQSSVPRFRVANIGLSYDRAYDLVVLTLLDMRIEEFAPDAILDEREFQQHVYTTRGQALLLGRQAGAAVAAGRPLCPQCDEPMDDFGHFCLPVQARRMGQRDLM